LHLSRYGCAQTTKPETEGKEETEMTANAIHKSYGFTAKAAAALLAFTIGAAPGVLADGGSGSSDRALGAIISHVEIAGGPAARMGLTKKEGKRLLYIADGAGKVMRVVDVTTPEQPGAVEQSGVTRRVPRLPAAALTAKSPDILAMLNSIGAKNSQQVHAFSGSASFLADVRHSLIFVMDGEGLWIVKAKQSMGEYTAPYDNSDYGTTYGG
jgi:hypothetical protein